MAFKSSRTIKPYGREWNSDRGAPDYDPQRDPWNSASPVYGQWPRRSWMRDVVKEPIWWALLAWFFVTFGLVLLAYLGVISDSTLLVGWMAKYLVLFGGMAIAGIWSLVAWFRKTPASERGPALRRVLRRAPGNIAWFMGLMAVCIGLDVIEKRYGVPFILTGGIALLLFFAISWWWQWVRKPAAG